MSAVVTSVVEAVEGGALRVNEYTLVASLGRGAYGEAILATVPAPDAAAGAPPRPVVLKAFSKARLLRQRTVRRVGDETLVTTGLDRALGEVAAMTRLRAAGGHPCVVGLRAVLADPASDDMFFALEFADAGPAMRLCDPARAADARHIQRVAAALEAASAAPRDPPAVAEGAAPVGASSSGDDFDVGDGVDVAAGGDVAGGDSGGAVGLCYDEEAPTAPASPSVFVGPAAAPVEGPLGPLPVPVARALAADLLAALAFAHGCGVAHRDVKPDNLLATSSGRAMLGDWGCAAVLTSTAEAADVEALRGAGAGAAALALPDDWVTDTVGTYAFLSPEACGMDAPAQSSASPGGGTTPPSTPSAANGEGVPGGYSAFPADAWAAGVSLFVMLFGVLPFGRAAGGPLGLFASIQSDPLLPLPVALADDPPAVQGDAGLVDVLSGLLHRDPAARLTPAAALSHPWFADAREQPRRPLPPLDTAALPPYVTPHMAMGARAGAGAAGSSGGSSLAPGACATLAAGWLWKRRRLLGLRRRRFFLLATAPTGGSGRSGAGLPPATALVLLASDAPPPAGWAPPEPPPHGWAAAAKRYTLQLPAGGQPLGGHGGELRLPVVGSGSTLHLAADSAQELAQWRAALQQHGAAIG